MFRKIAISLTKPPLAIFFLKDAWSKIILYLIFLPFFMILPSIISLAIDPSMSADSYQEISNAMLSDFRFTDVTLENYQLTYSETSYVELDSFDISIGYINDIYNVTFVFETEGVAVYYLDQQLDFQTYEALDFESHDFTSTALSDISQISIVIKNLYEQQTVLFVSDMILQYFVYLIDFIFVILIMTFLSSLMSPMIKLPYKLRFKFSTYLSTIYIFSNFILILLGLYALNVISMVLVYVYHLWAYKKLTVIPKGAAPNVNQ